MSLSASIAAAVADNIWQKVKSGLGEGGKELLKNPWPAIMGLRSLADMLEQYARSQGIPEPPARKE